jgi:hypothetical protein
MKTSQIVRTVKLAPKKSSKKAKAPQLTAMPGFPPVTVQSLVVKANRDDLVTVIRARIPEVREKVEGEIAKQPSKEVKIGMASAEYCREAVGVACVVEEHLEESEEYPVSFGPHTARLGGDVGATIVYLVDELRKCDNMLSQNTSTDAEAFKARCFYCLVEIRTACEVVVDDGVEDDKDVLVRGLRKKHESHPRTQATIADALGSYVTAARGLAPELSTLVGFDMAVIEEAQSLVDTLMGKSSSTPGQRKVRLRRNRIVFLLRKLVVRTRKLGRFVFRQHPEVIREMASAFHRNRRIAERGQDAADDTDDEDLVDDDSQEPDTEPTEPSAKKPA